jgi:hypothetical protein
VRPSRLHRARQLPRAQVAEAPAVAQIRIGPAPAVTSRASITIEEAIVTKPTKLVIASANPARQQSTSPY